MAAKKKKVFYNVPGVGYVSKEVVSNTKFIQDKKTGQLKGRKKVDSKGDKIKRTRVKQDFTLVKRSKNSRGHIRQTKKSYEKGQFI